MRRPRISANLAISADGKISSVSNRPSGWTSSEDHRRFLKLRENADAILVGRGTFTNDRMTLTGPKNPLRCIVSRTGKIDPAHPIFQTPGGAIHWLVTGETIVQTSADVTIHHTNLPHFMEILADQHGVTNLHCEGGGELIRELAELDFIDNFHLTIAGHTLFGGQMAPTLTGIAGKFLSTSRSFEISSFEAFPELGECFVSYTRS